ncbi:hypothetical protein WJX73_003239 [Symbiochloris irregularis]|uniref:Sugar phosphate transporter domain-containing protein n=1 Tax=Symbiochloris irregularis TaxID=706552 RepID=A0AAW1PLC2_9CHLO
MSAAALKPVCYGLLNIASAASIVFANKIVLTTYGFRFLSALALIHTVTTAAGMQVFCWFGVFEKKHLPLRSITPLAGAFVGYIVLNNLNLRLNTVGFYQITKIAVAPAVLCAEAAFFGKRSSKAVVASILVTELSASSFQLLHQYCPIATILLAVLVPVMEPLGLTNPTPDTLLGFPYDVRSNIAIAISSVLGLVVSLSTFLVIGATSSLTYNVVGHVKTVIILVGGVVFFGDRMPLTKVAGISLAMAGIIWYSQLKLAAASSARGAPPLAPATPRASADEESVPLTKNTSPTGPQRRDLPKAGVEAHTIDAMAGISVKPPSPVRTGIPPRSPASSRA